MKKILVSLFTISALVACEKEDKTPDPVKDALATLQGKYLVCDSVKTTANGVTTKQVLGKGKGWDRSFGLYGNLDIYSSPTVYKNYSYGSPDKIYYWNTGSSYQADQFYTILSVNSSKLVVVENDKAAGKVYTEYFTAE